MNAEEAYQLLYSLAVVLIGAYLQPWFVSLPVSTRSTGPSSAA